MQMSTAVFETYPYLASALIVLAMYLGAAVAFPTHAKAAFLSALLAAPWGLQAVALVPDYWEPWSVFRFGRVGVEDFIWAFGTGGLAWLIAAAPHGGRYALVIDPFLLRRRYLVINLIGACFFLPLWFGGVKFISTYLISTAMLGMVLVRLRPELWRLAVSGAAGFAIWYFLTLKSVLSLWPQFADQWTSHNLCGVFLLGIPLEEFAWGTVTGTVWPLVAGYVFNIRTARASTALS